jgi:hypothetical protein
LTPIAPLTTSTHTTMSLTDLMLRYISD